MSLGLEQIKNSLPKGGLFEGGWRYSPEPLKLTKSEARAISSLGHPLARFQDSCDEIYRRSANESLPGWIAELLDAGKPTWMVELQREVGRQGQRPRVIRPDLLLDEDGFSLTELDSVPGGMGITAWLSKLYSDAGFEVLGGSDGMIKGFGSILDEGGAVVISEEASDYQREMEWLVAQVGGDRSVVPAEDFRGDTSSIYRFFEWFDWETMPLFRSFADQSVDGSIKLTPPCLPHLEEKLWLALLWTPALQPLWKEVLRGSHLRRIRDIIPFGWVVDPSPLPPQAALPRLDVHSWNEVAGFSQQDRELVLKISGFDEMAWGSRGVFIGHDLPAAEWKQRIDNALSDFSAQPWIMQEFSDTRIVEHPVYREDGEVEMLRGRVRLCPYYFTDDEGQTSLGGCMATLAPVDKKKIHGMRDGALLPVTIA